MEGQEGCESDNMAARDRTFEYDAKGAFTDLFAHTVVHTNDRSVGVRAVQLGGRHGCPSRGSRRCRTGEGLGRALAKSTPACSGPGRRRRRSWDKTKTMADKYLPVCGVSLRTFLSCRSASYSLLRTIN
jgi:hypothetical protein